MHREYWVVEAKQMHSAEMPRKIFNVFNNEVAAIQFAAKLRMRGYSAVHWAL